MNADERVEQELHDLSQHLPSIPQRDLSGRVLERIAADAAVAPTRSRRARLVLAAGGVCLALVAAYGLFSPVRDAAASALRLVGIDIEHADEGARPPAVSPPDRSELGERVPVASVSDAAGFDVPVPQTSTLGAADEAYVVDGGSYQVVTLVWRERPDIPTSPASDASALLSVFRGAPPDGDWVKKILYLNAEAHRVTVNGGLGVFVSGPQAVRYVGANGDLREVQSRLSANSLIWLQDGVTLRLETALGEAASVAIAETVR